MKKTCGRGLGSWDQGRVSNQVMWSGVYLFSPTLILLPRHLSTPSPRFPLSPWSHPLSPLFLLLFSFCPSPLPSPSSYRFPDTRTAIAYESQGMFDFAQESYEKGMKQARELHNIGPAPPSVVTEYKLWEEHWSRLIIHVQCTCAYCKVMKLYSYLQDVYVHVHVDVLVNWDNGTRWMNLVNLTEGLTLS